MASIIKSLRNSKVVLYALYVISLFHLVFFAIRNQLYLVVLFFASAAAAATIVTTKYAVDILFFSLVIIHLVKFLVIHRRRFSPDCVRTHGGCGGCGGGCGGRAAHTIEGLDGAGVPALEYGMSSKGIDSKIQDQEKQKGNLIGQINDIYLSNEQQIADLKQSLADAKMLQAQQGIQPSTSLLPTTDTQDWSL
jgi:hypothetical protein